MALTFSCKVCATQIDENAMKPEKRRMNVFFICLLKSRFTETERVRQDIVVRPGCWRMEKIVVRMKGRGKRESGGSKQESNRNEEDLTVVNAKKALTT